MAGLCQYLLGVVLFIATTNGKLDVLNSTVLKSHNMPTAVMFESKLLLSRKRTISV